MSPNPCRDCNNRTATCHATCHEYSAWKKEYDALQAKVRAEKEMTWTLDEARESGYKRRRRRKK